MKALLNGLHVGGMFHFTKSLDIFASLYGSDKQKQFRQSRKRNRLMQ